MRLGQKCPIKIMSKGELTDRCWTPSPEDREFTFFSGTRKTFIKLSVHENLNKFPEVEITGDKDDGENR